jgi:hypothetical protein
MAFHEREVVWFDASGEEPCLARIYEVDFELYILVDVKPDEEFHSPLPHFFGNTKLERSPRPIPLTLYMTGIWWGNSISKSN